MTSYAYINLLGLVVAVFVRPCLGADAKSFHAFVADGVIVEQSFHQDKSAMNSITNRFELAVHGNTWRMRTLFGIEYYEDYAYDGTNTYGLLVMEQGITNNLYSPATIRRGAYPLDGFCTTRVVWLAMASVSSSRAYLRDLQVVPWGHAQCDGAFSCTAMPEFTPQGFPSQVEFRVSEGLWRKELLFKKHSSKRHPFMWTDGEVVGLYRLLATTNVAGQRIPQRFHLERFATVPGSSERYLIESFSGVVTRVSTNPPAFTYPTLRKGADVFDFRFGDDSRWLLNVRYQLTNISDGWRPVTDPELLRLANVARTNYPRFLASLYRPEDPGWTMRRLVGVSMLAFAFLGPLILIVRHRMMGTRYKGKIQPQNKSESP